MRHQPKSDAASGCFIELEGVREHACRLGGRGGSRRLRDLAARGQVAYICTINSPRPRERDTDYIDRRTGERREVRLRSGKLLDMRRRFLCECLTVGATDPRAYLGLIVNAGPAPATAGVSA